MSYDLGLVDENGAACRLDEPFMARGGTWALGGTKVAEFNITYNYSEHFARVFPDREVDGKTVKGIRTIYGMTGVESIRFLLAGMQQLGDDVSHDYWEATEGNAKMALRACLELARLCPDGIWTGD